MNINRRKFCKNALIIPATAVLFLDQSARGFSDETSTISAKVNYMLRYYMRSETAKQQTEDLIAYCRLNHINHIIFFSSNQWDMGWNMPTLDEVRTRVEVLRPVFKKLREENIKLSINVWTTIGHGDVGRDERKRHTWQLMVGDDGTESKSCPCPISQEYKKFIGKLYGMFAELEPEIIYIDDDFRYHNHSPISWGCFCPLHLEEMARRTGKKLTREELLHRILNAMPQPTEERKHWLALCGDSILEIAVIMSNAVKEVSPHTHMGLMCSSPNVHAAEGRRWLDMFTAFSVSGSKPYLRPNYASYEDVKHTEVPAHITNMRKLQPLLGNKAHITPELENEPNTRFSKSARLTRLQMALSFLLASPGLTLDINSFTETGFDYDNNVDKMLRDSFDYFNTITAWAAESARERGLQILWDDRFPLHRKVNGNRMSMLPAPHVWEGILDLIGFATTFYPDEVKLASRSYLEERTEDELSALLKGKLLMDGDAAAFLFEKGLGQKIGLQGIQSFNGVNYERMVNEKFSGKYLNRDMTVYFSGKYRIEPIEQAIIISRMNGPEGNPSLPGMMVFENSDGGRIGIIPQNGSSGDFNTPNFRNWKRQQALLTMLEWMNQGALPLFIEDAANVFPIRRDGNNTMVIGIANLSGDPLPQISFRVGTLLQGNPLVECLTNNGVTKYNDIKTTIGRGYLNVLVPAIIQPLDMFCFRIKIV